MDKEHILNPGLFFNDSGEWKKKPFSAMQPRNIMDDLEAATRSLSWSDLLTPRFSPNPVKPIPYESMTEEELRNAVDTYRSKTGRHACVFRCGSQDMFARASLAFSAEGYADVQVVFDDYDTPEEDDE